MFKTVACSVKSLVPKLAQRLAQQSHLVETPTAKLLSSLEPIEDRFEVHTVVEVVDLALA
jgi:hypothetical protein